MNRTGAIGVLIVSVSLLGASAVFGIQDPYPPGPPPHPGHGMDGGMFLSALNLTDAQKSRINAIDEGERAKTSSTLEQLREARQAIESATANGQFDEQQIRTLAKVEAELQVEMTVARARRSAAIFEILSADQRVLLEQLKTAQRSPQHFSGSFERQ